MNGDEALKQSLWLEAMMKSGFGPLPLQLLGIADLAEAAAGAGAAATGAVEQVVISGAVVTGPHKAGVTVTLPLMK